MTTTDNRHLSEDDLVLHYYGELTGGEESRASAHLAACATCHESFRRLQRVLAVVDERTVAGPELPEHFERTVWARLEPSLRRERGAWLSWFTASPGRLAWVGVVVLLIAGSFAAGRFASRTNEGATEIASTEQIRERILLVDLGDHLDRSQMVLIELVSADDQGPVDISNERDRAEELVAANRLYRQTAASTGNGTIADLLDELERVLVDVAASPGEVSQQQLDEVRRRIESRSLLFKVRVVSSEVRERQRSLAEQRAAQRSSL
jgi:hypothetical protein